MVAAVVVLIPAGRVSRSTSRPDLILSADVGATGAATPASCAPSVLNRSALLGGAVTVSPLPDSRDASPLSQISLLGVPASELSGVRVRGSRSGSHSGRLEAYSQGDGASFVLSHPFSPGEHVSVRAILTQGGVAKTLSFGFDVAAPDTAGAAGGSARPRSEPRDYQHFQSRPELRPPTITVTAHSPAASPGDLLLAPYSGPGQYGPMILDESGTMVWFKPLEPAGTRAADLRVQSYEGKQVLTWWQDPLVTATSRKAGIVIDDASYRQIAVVRAGNGYQPDLHEFQITPRGTALITVYDGIDCDLSAIGGPAEGAVADTLLQELDLKTGLVRYEWHSLDHVPLSDSYASPRPGTRKEPFDFFHVNSIDVTHDGSLLIDARNTWAAYDTDARTGQVRWRLGGRRSSFRLGPGAVTAYQHDAREQPNGDITFFDNGATPKVHPQSRVIELHLDRTAMTATLVRREEHDPPLVAGSQGNMQAEANGDWTVGWGQSPYLSEFAADGQMLLDAHMPATYESYRTYRQSWTGTPLSRPAIALSRSHGHVTAYASWNGATGVASWRVLTGPTAAPASATAVAGAPRSGFETAIVLARAPAAGSWVSVQALSATGEVLGAAVSRRL